MGQWLETVFSREQIKRTEEFISMTTGRHTADLSPFQVPPCCRDSDFSTNTLYILGLPSKDHKALVTATRTAGFKRLQAQAGFLTTLEGRGCWFRESFYNLTRYLAEENLRRRRIHNSTQLFHTRETSFEQ